MEEEKLLTTVEKLRGKMYKLMAGREKLTDQELLNISRKIDELLNKYLKEKYN